MRKQARPLCLAARQLLTDGAAAPLVGARPRTPLAKLTSCTF